MGRPIDWVICYLASRSNTSSLMEQHPVSRHDHVCVGVLRHRSVLRPTRPIRAVYAADVILLIEDCDVHAYADDLQVYWRVELWIQHSLPISWRGWQTALHVLKDERQAIGFVSAHLVWVASESVAVHSRCHDRVQFLFSTIE